MSAVVTGSTVGLVMAGVFAIGGLGKAQQPAATQMLTPVAAAQTAAPAANNPTIADTINRQGARSGDLLKASLRGPAAQPFTSKSQSDLDCLAEAVYYEARGEGAAGQAAVAQVVLNRVRHPSFPKSVCAVVYQGCQFSFACNGAMRARKEPGAWNRARSVAARALAGAVAVNVGNATHFHTINVAPQWGPNLLRVGQVGLHVFYRFGGRAGRPSAFSAPTQVASSDETTTTEYRRLAPEERVYMTSLTAVKPQDLAVKPGVGGPLGPVEEPASAPAAETAAQPAAAEVKASTTTTLKSSAAPSSSAVS